MFRCIKYLIFFSLLPVCSFAWQMCPYGEIPPQAALKIVFVPAHYQNKEAFLKDSEALIQRLKDTVPFNEFRERIAFYFIDVSEVEKELFFKDIPAAFPPLSVREGLLRKIRDVLRSEYKLVIVDERGSISCAELSLADRMSVVILGRKRYLNEESFAKGFLHELGHSLGLREEGVHCTRFCPPGPPNCATSLAEAEQWWGGLLGRPDSSHYIRGCCGNRNYYRPSIASLMNAPDKAADFGIVNEDYLRKALNNMQAIAEADLRVRPNK